MRNGRHFNRRFAAMREMASERGPAYEEELNWRVQHARFSRLEMR